MMNQRQPVNPSPDFLHRMQLAQSQAPTGQRVGDVVGPSAPIGAPSSTTAPAYVPPPPEQPGLFGVSQQRKQELNQLQQPSLVGPSPEELELLMRMISFQKDKQQAPNPPSWISGVRG